MSATDSLGTATTHNTHTTHQGGIISYFGTVNYATNERTLAELERRARAGEQATLLVTSTGGPSGTAMSFYDTVRHVLKLSIATIGSGDVDSSGMIIFLSGSDRFVTPHTTALLHPAGRVFDQHKRYTAEELRAMYTEDAHKDMQYASILAESSGGRLSIEDVLKLMKLHTVLTPADFIHYGFAQAVLQ